MCIVVYKPKNVEMPKDENLKECFRTNRDGAGYMFTEDGVVNIKKGFMTYDSFKEELDKDYSRLGSTTPFVLHFRIGTQGGNIKENTHPFPLSKNMSDLKKLNFKTNCGIAHNGIIDLTTTRGGDYKIVYDSKLKCNVQQWNPVNYSDTMKFITDYLALIIKNKNWYKDDSNLELIEKLAGSTNKFAIMNGDGHVQLIGNFIEDGGVFYSNSSYKVYDYNDWDFEDDYYYDKKERVWKRKKQSKKKSKTDDELYEEMLYDEFQDSWNPATGLYEPDINECPMSVLEEYDLCECCKHFNKCYGLD